MSAAGANLLLLGYGFLGRCFVRCYGGEFKRVFVTSRSAAKLAALPDKAVTSLTLDINAGDGWPALETLPPEPLAVCCFVTPSQVDAAAFSAFLQRLSRLAIRRAVLTSSTVVYGADNRKVDSDSAVSLDNERARCQATLEEIWRQNLRRTGIVRLAGLYGAERVIGKQSLLSGETLPGTAEDWLNLIHVADAAALVKAMLDSDLPGPELGCDDTPLRRGEYYSTLARCLGTAPPVFSHRGDRRGRINSNALTKTRLRWQPRYDSCLRFLAERYSSSASDSPSGS